MHGTSNKVIWLLSSLYTRVFRRPFYSNKTALKVAIFIHSKKIRWFFCLNGRIFKNDKCPRFFRSVHKLSLGTCEFPFKKWRKKLNHRPKQDLTQIEETERISPWWGQWPNLKNLSRGLNLRRGSNMTCST